MPVARTAVAWLAMLLCLGSWCLGGALGIAVGTAVTGGPPRRSVREALPHTALAASRTRKRSFG